jgi:cyclohexa-1,5-dienecarbonyl-CoA hydratase
MSTPTQTEAGIERGVRFEELEHGAIWRATLATPKANVIDAPKVAALRELFLRARDARELKAVVIEGEGPHFSFGASVEEHLPERCARMLEAFHALLRALLDANVACLAAVRGQCLGGGLELAALCHRVFASRDAKLGQPEIVLGVFAPAASVALIERVGRGAAEDLLISGRSLDAEDALRIGLVDQVDEDPTAAALLYARAHLLPKSASSLRHAVRAARAGFRERFERELATAERHYLAELMATEDALEGLRAFLDKRPPRWRNA